MIATYNIWRSVASASGCRESESDHVAVELLSTNLNTHILSRGFSVSSYNDVELLPKYLLIATEPPANLTVYTHTLTHTYKRAARNLHCSKEEGTTEGC